MSKNMRYTIKAKTKNTNPKFYEKWSREQLIKELCRLNQLLVDLGKELKKVKSSLKKM